MGYRMALGVLLVLIVSACATDVRAAEPVIGGLCEGCEAVFDRIPDALGPRARLGRADEKGERLRIEGTVRDGAGAPVAGIIVYAYQTDARGIYPPDDLAKTRFGRRHGRLRAWARTDSLGRYRFDSVRPASYPGTSIPQHVHMHVIEPGCCTYYIDDVLFDDDPMLTAGQRRSMSRGRGGAGIVAPRRANGGWQVVRDIVLGANVPGYAEAKR